MVDDSMVRYYCVNRLSNFLTQKLTHKKSGWSFTYWVEAALSLGAGAEPESGTERDLVFDLAFLGGIDKQWQWR